MNESRTINQFQYLDWQEDQCPTSASSVVDMIGWLTKMQYHRGGGPVVIHDWYVYHIWIHISCVMLHHNCVTIHMYTVSNICDWILENHF